jgi:Dna[CI] antecedent, DciA
VIESHFPMKRIGEFLAPALRQTVARQSPFTWLAEAWPAIVGRRIAEHSRPSRLSSGVLDVAVKNKSWRNELTEMAGEFRERINSAWSGNLVREIQFSAGHSGPRLRHEFDNDYTPFVRGKRRGGDLPAPKPSVANSVSAAAPAGTASKRGASGEITRKPGRA